MHGQSIREQDPTPAHRTAASGFLATPIIVSPRWRQSGRFRLRRREASPKMPAVRDRAAMAAIVRGRNADGGRGHRAISPCWVWRRFASAGSRHTPAWLSRCARLSRKRCRTSSPPASTSWRKGPAGRCSLTPLPFRSERGNDHADRARTGRPPLARLRRERGSRGRRSRPARRPGRSGRSPGGPPVLTGHRPLRPGESASRGWQRRSHATRARSAGQCRLPPPWGDGIRVSLAGRRRR
jgi:hypothetical protein